MSITWKSAGSFRGASRSGRKGMLAVQVSMSETDPVRISFGMGVEEDGQFRPTAYLDARDVDMYLMLLFDAREAVATAIKNANEARAVARAARLIVEQGPKPLQTRAPIPAAPLKASLGDMMRAKGKTPTP